MIARLIDWILANPGEFSGYVAVVSAIIMATVSAWRIGGFRKALLALMLQADRARRQGKLGAIDGPAVMALVVQFAVSRLVPQLPFWIRPLVTPDRIEQWLQQLFDWSLDLLDDGHLNGTRPTLPDDAA